MNNTGSRGSMRVFLIIWFGQLVSLVGSQLTGFALGVWVYDQTRSVLMLALTMVAVQAPMVILSPIAGVLADRWDRRTAMIVSDFGAGLAVLAAAILYLTQRLQPWMVTPINFWMAAFGSLIWPAYTASVSLLVPGEQYGRANGIVQLGEAIPQIAGPAIAGALYVIIHVGNERHMLRETMTALEGRLAARKFIRISRSVIVNADRIKELQPMFHGEYVVVLRNGAKLTLSRNYRDKLPDLGLT